MRILYNLLILIIIVLSPIIIFYRILKKKEDPNRFLEKFSLLQKKRVKGKLIWFHCSSVGELLSIAPLVEKLEKEHDIKNILISTSTLSSSRIFNKFKFKKTFHQFYPIDNPFIVNKFINYWNPSAVFFVESEIWPEMLITLKRKKIKIFLLNARISKNSFKRWKYFKNMAVKIFGSFDYIFPQNKETFNYLKYFKVKKINILGNLKFSETEKEKKVRSSQKKFTSKKVLCAASTHYNEEEIISNIHLDLRKKVNNLLTIIIPRHIERIQEILEDLNKKKLKYVLHSESVEIKDDTDVYLVDTYGESKMFYALSKVVFLGGSLVPRGGQNPLEPVRYGCFIIHGKYTFNFNEIYNFLQKKKLSFEAKNSSQLKRLVLNLLKKRSNNKKDINKLKKIGSDILKKHYNKIRVLI